MARKVPRYTSYPMAPHFSNAVDLDAYTAWLATLNPVSLYLHVPFCREHSFYCAYNKKLVKKEAPVTKYAESLRHEISLLAQHLPSRMKVSHLHRGGGMPTALRPDDLEATMILLAEKFDIIADAKLAIECGPRTLTPEMISRIGKTGFTRAS